MTPQESEGVFPGIYIFHQFMIPPESEGFFSVIRIFYQFFAADLKFSSPIHIFIDFRQMT